MCPCKFSCRKMRSQAAVVYLFQTWIKYFLRKIRPWIHLTLQILPIWQEQGLLLKISCTMEQFSTIHITIAIKYLDIIFPLSYVLLFVAKVWPWFATRGYPNVITKVGVRVDSKLDMIFLCLSEKNGMWWCFSP